MNEGHSLRYAHVETLIAALLDVNASRKGTLTARFKQLRRLSFPPGVNTGSANFAYDLDKVMMVVVGFAMLDTLIAPKPMTKMLSEGWPEVRKEISRLIRRIKIGSSGQVEVKRADCRWLVVEPHAHRHWSLAESATSGSDEDDGRDPGSLRLLAGDELKGRLAAGSDAFPVQSLIVVDLFGYIFWATQALVKADWATLEDIKAAMPAD